MTDEQLISRAKSLQVEADRILKKLNLLAVIGTISKPEIVGSAKSGLMTKPDIDIHAWMERPDLDTISNLLPVLAKVPTIQMVQLCNYLDYRRDYKTDRVDFPHAYYVGFRTMQPSGEWKVDMWFGEHGKIGNYDDSELSVITDGQRLIILRLKDAWSEEKGYKNGVISTDFYKAVMQHSVNDEKGFAEYIATKDSDAITD